MERSISLIMPAFNEEEAIEFTVRSVKEKLKQYCFDYEILIFNDASDDETGKIAEKLSVEDPKIMVFHNSKNMNLGYNFARGISMASKTFVGLWPCHGLIASKSLDYILPALRKTDIVVGYIKNSEVRPWTRQIISKINVIILNLLFGFKLPYYHLNFYRTDQLKKVPTSTASYALMVELLVYLVASGADYIETPFFLRERLTGKSKALRFKNIINILKTYANLFWQVRICRRRIDLKGA